MNINIVWTLQAAIKPLFYSFLVMQYCSGGDQPVAIYTERHKQNKIRQTFMSRAVFELITQTFGLRKTVHNIDRAASVIGSAAFEKERQKRMMQIPTKNSLLTDNNTEHMYYTFRCARVLDKKQKNCIYVSLNHTAFCGEQQTENVCLCTSVCVPARVTPGEGE